jgi:hypothetical protein
MFGNWLLKKLNNLWEWKTFGVRLAKGRVDQAKAAGSGAASYSCHKNCCLNREIINLPVCMYGTVKLPLAKIRECENQSI